MGTGLRKNSRESNVCALGPEFVAHSQGSVVHALLVPGRRNGHTRGKGTDKIRRAESGRSVLEAEAGEVEARDRIDVADAGARLSGNHKGLLFERQLSDKGRCLHSSFCPDSITRLTGYRTVSR